MASSVVKILYIVWGGQWFGYLLPTVSMVVDILAKGVGKLYHLWYIKIVNDDVNSDE